MFDQTIVIGNLGGDPELRYTSEGTAVASFSIATNRKWTNKDGSPGEETKWFRISAWRTLGENCAKYLKKGSPAMVLGRVTAGAYMSKDGTAKASLDLEASNVIFLPKGGEKAAADAFGGGNEEEAPF